MSYKSFGIILGGLILLLFVLVKFSDSNLFSNPKPKIAITSEPYIEPVKKVIPIPEILNSSDEFNHFPFRGSPEYLIKEVDEFMNAWKYIFQNDTSSNKKKWEQRLKGIQIKEFPLLRKEYGTLLRNVLWDEDIDVSVSGKLSKTISFTGHYFASNKEIKSMMDKFQPPLIRYRFSKVIFKWYKGQDDYTYYELSSMTDDDEVYEP